MAGSLRKSSDVWKYFRKEDSSPNSVLCTICERSFSYRGGTTNLRDHLERQHSSIYQPKPTSSKQATLVGIQKCSERHSKEVTQRILNFIIKDIRPIAVVKGEGFMEMVKLMEPGYTIPCRKHFVKLLQEKFLVGVTNLKKILRDDVEKFAITTDIWTSLTNESYMSLTVHYISKEWEMLSCILETVSFPDHHTGVNIAKMIKDVVLSTFEIVNSKVVAIVHDQGSNIQLGARILEDENRWKSVSCAAHKLQLCIEGALKSEQHIARAIDAAKKLVGHFKHSSLATAALKKRQEQMSLPTKKLKQDVATRWNSTYYMLERLLEMRWPVVAVLSDESVTKRSDRYLDMRSDQWGLLEEVVKVLEPLETATVFLSYEHNESISCLYPVLFGIIENLAVTEDDSPACSHLKIQIVSSITSRWSLNLIDPCELHVIATSLDPRFRNLRFLSDTQRKAVKEFLKGRVTRMQQSSQSTGGSSQTPPPPKKTALDKLLGDEQQESVSEHEVDAYFAEKVVSRLTNPLEWWKNNESRFPLIAVIAKSFLCVPVTSAPSERVFSKAGLIVSKLRSNLKPKNVNALLFLNKNMKLLNK